MSKFNKPSRPFSDKKRSSGGQKERSFKKSGDSFDRDSKPRKDDRGPKRTFSKDKDYKNRDDYKKSERAPRRDEGSSSESSERGYKQKRSFTKNKELRSGSGFKKDGFDKKRSFSKNDKYSDKSGSDREKKFSRFAEKPERFSKDRSFKEKKPYNSEKSGEGLDREKRYTRSSDKPGEYKERRSFKSEGYSKDSSDREKRYTKSSDKPRDFKERGSYKSEGFKKDSSDRDKKYAGVSGKSREYKKDDRKDERPFKRKHDGDDEGKARRVKYDEFEEGKSFSKSYSKDFSKSKSIAPKRKSEGGDGLTRLNKYLANAGIASRREADTLIKSGVVKVNGVPVTEMGYKIKQGDTVTYGDAAVKSERKVYLVLNKPKDYITTVDDPKERKTVMSLIEAACKERVYPVGRLDRNTTGILMFTNDGDLTKKLTHPKHEIKKVYHVSLNKGLKAEDFKAITEGIELEDGMIKADDLAFVGEGKKEVGIEIHSGRNRIVRRIFEHLGYEILKLDRVTFAGLTKKDLPRGKYRFLTQKEVSFLQMIG